MAALPSFDVTGNLFNILGEVIASELTAATLSGTITFTSNVPSTEFVTWEGDLHRVGAVIARVSGSGISYNGHPLKLLANDAGLSVNSLQWHAAVSVKPDPGSDTTKTMRDFWFDAPVDGGTVDLATVVPVVATTVVGLTRGERGYPIDDVQLVGVQAQFYVQGVPVGDPLPLTPLLEAVIAGAPGALDTLNELAAALGDDANYAATVATALAGKAPLASPTFTGTVAGITKTMVGLGSADNVSDVNKPVSTAQQAALDLKAVDTTVAHLAGTETVTGAKNFTGGITKSGNAVVDTTDARLSDTRTPTDATVTTAKFVASALVTAAETLASSNNDTSLPTTAAVIAAITAGGGYTPGGTDVAVADGGTGASTAAAARTNLGATTTGSAVFTAADGAAVRATIGDPAVFSTADYAAVSGNDRPRVASAVAAAVAAITATGKDQTVLIHAPLTFTSGVTKPPLAVTADPNNVAYGQQGVPIPCGLAARLHIVFAPGAKIILSASCETAFYIDKQADYDVLQNVDFYDAWVDGANQPALSHALIGNYMEGGKVRYLSFQDINFWGKTRFTNFYWSAAGAAFAYFGIAFFGEHVAPLEATQTFSKNIHADSVHMEGGNGLFAVCSQAAARSRPGGVNHYYDNITIDDYRYVAPSVSTDYAKQAGTGVFICGAGFGGYCRIGPGYVENVGDDAIEVGAMQRIVIEQPRSKDARLLGIMLRQTHAPIDVETQKITIRGFDCQVTSALTSQAGGWGAPIRLYVDDQVVTLTGTATGGTGTITVPGYGTTSALANNASAATIQAAVRALHADLSLTVASGGPLGTGTVTLKVAQVNLATPITISTGSLTGGTWTLALSPLNASFGTVTIEDAVWKVDGLTYSKHLRTAGLFVYGLDQPHRKVEIIRPKVVWSNYTFDAATTEDLSLYAPAAPYTGWGHVIIRDHDLTLAGTCNFKAGAGQGGLLEVNVGGTGTKVQIDGMTNDRASSVNGSFFMVAVGRVAGSGIRVQMRRLFPRTLAAGVTNGGARLYDTGVVSQFDVLDSDFSQGTTTIASHAFNLNNASTNAPIARARGCIWPEGLAGAAITVGASVFTWQNTLGFTALVQISGGTVSLVRYKGLGAGFRTSQFTSGTWTVEPGASLEVTYSVVPTMSYDLVR